MSALAQRARLTAALAWLAAPALAQVLVGNDVGRGALPGVLALSAGTFALPLAWTRGFRGLLLSLAPLALLSGFAAAYLLTYRTPLTAGLVQSLLVTDLREAGEQAGRYASIAALCLAGWAGYLWCAWTLPREAAVPFRRAWIAGAAWTVLLAIYHPYVQFELYHRLDVLADFSFVRKSYPLNLAFIAGDLQAAGTFRPNEHEFAGPALLPPERRLAGPQREVYVLVIGEAAQARIWAELDATSDPASVYFGDALAQANLSHTSVEMLVTGATTLSEARRLPTLVDWQAAAGCTTAVVSNSTPFRSSGRAQIRYVTQNEELDHDLLPVIEGLVANAALRKLCVIVHTLGSHQDYRSRYTARFARFPVEGYPALPGLLGAYRNSILSSQDFLRSLTHMLARNGGTAFLAYTADHGENLGEVPGSIEHGSLQPTPYEMQVPMLYWASPSFVTSRPEHWEQLQRNRTVPVSNADVVPTLIDAMGYLDDLRRLHPGAVSLLRQLGARTRRYVAPDFTEHPESDMQPDPARREHAIRLQTTSAP